MHRLTRSLIVTMGAAAVFVLPACGSDKQASPSTSATATTIAPEDIKVPDAQVTAGLKQMPATIAAAIAAIGTPDARAKLDAIEALWSSFEGTVRDKDATIYLSIEDSLTPLQRQIGAGDATTATTTSQTLAQLFTQYLTKYPS